MCREYEGGVQLKLVAVAVLIGQDGPVQTIQKFFIGASDNFEAGWEGGVGFRGQFCFPLALGRWCRCGRKITMSGTNDSRPLAWLLGAFTVGHFANFWCIFRERQKREIFFGQTSHFSDTSLDSVFSYERVVIRHPLDHPKYPLHFQHSV